MADDDFLEMEFEPEKVHEPGFFSQVDDDTLTQVIKVLMGLIAIVFSVMYIQNFFKVKRLKFVQGWPIFGSLNQFHKTSPHVFLTILRKQYGGIYQIQIGRKQVIVVCSKEGIEEGLMRRGAIFCDRPDSTSAKIVYKGDKQNGLLMADYTDKFQKKKSVLNGCIYSGKYMMSQIDQKITEGIYKLAWEFQSHAGEPLNPRDLLSCGIFNLLLWIVFNTQFEYNSQLFIKLLYLNDIRFKSAYGLKADFLPFLDWFGPCTKSAALKLSNSLIKEFPLEQINDHKETYDPDDIRDILDSILHQLDLNYDFGVLNDTDVYYMLLDLISHSFEPLTATLEWCLLYLANYPEVQHKVQEEIDRVVGEERFPTLEDRVMMPYTCAVILEVQRMVTVMPFGLPHKTMIETKFQGYKLPEGSNILFNFWSLNHDRRWWIKPGDFNPERFLTTDGALNIPEYFLPYGAGRRKCLGPDISDSILYLFISCVLHQLTIKPVLKDGEKSLDTESEYINFVLLPKAFEIIATDRKPDLVSNTGDAVVPESTEDVETIDVIEDDETSKTSPNECRQRLNPNFSYL